MWQRDYAAPEPETDPAAVRLLPPAPPPAPPGTGSPPPPSASGPTNPGCGGDDLPPGLFEALNHFAVIRTTFETLALFPEDEGLAAEMFEIVRQAHEALVDDLRRLADYMLDERARRHGTSLWVLRAEIERLASQGASSRQIDSIMKTDVCSRARSDGSQPVRCWLLQHVYDPVTWKELSDAEFVARAFQEVARRLGPPPVREHEIAERAFQDYIMLVFACFATLDPMFFSSNPTPGDEDRRRD